jgi:hypothetical protein
MTLLQGIELAHIAKEKGYVLAASKGKVQFQVLNPDGSVRIRITRWVGYKTAKNLMLNND